MVNGYGTVIILRATFDISSRKVEAKGSGYLDDDMEDGSKLLALE